MELDATYVADGRADARPFPSLTKTLRAISSSRLGTPVPPHDAQGVLGELRPGAEVASGAPLVDQRAQGRVDTAVDAVVDGDDLEHLLRGEGLEPHVSVEAGVEHRLAVEHLVAAGTSAEEKAKVVAGSSWRLRKTRRIMPGC